ncbi:four-carbon acid sugar kinase family protein [Treponema primitia]|uniref:four-carbon acid sugar kinase family protein n=1 Tax=Treponema primitia TaxID=88058 RepID=UPI0039800677
MDYFLIVADDLTGANDTGVQIRRRGIPTSVVFSSKLITGQDSCVLDTESRGFSDKDAFDRVSGEIASIPFEKFAYVMKKVDSTLRGKMGSETKAIDTHFKSELIICAPALPDLGRTTVDKIHLLNGVPVSQTEIARDPKAPVTEDNIHKLMSASFDEPVVHIGLDAVRSGNIPLEKGRIFTFDAASNEDMRNIILAALGTKKRVLWVGTAAMADNLLSIKDPIPPALAVVGSLSSVSRGQVLYAEKQGIQLVKVPMYDVLEKKIKLEDIVAQVVGLLKSGKDALLHSASTYSADELKKSNDAAARQNMAIEALSLFTQKTLGQLIGQILNEVTVSGLFLTGGDTAMSFFEVAESSGSSITTEIAVGIPLMRLRGGRFEGLKIVTKAGAFGKEDALFYGLRKLKEAD